MSEQYSVTKSQTAFAWWLYDIGEADTSLFDLDYHDLRAYFEQRGLVNMNKVVRQHIYVAEHELADSWLVLVVGPTEYELIVEPRHPLNHALKAAGYWLANGTMPP